LPNHGTKALTDRYTVVPTASSPLLETTGIQ